MFFLPLYESWLLENIQEIIVWEADQLYTNGLQELSIQRMIQIWGKIVTRHWGDTLSDSNANWSIEEKIHERR